MRRWFCFYASVQVLCLAGMLLSAGCSGGGLTGLYPVRGTVTLNGKPLEGATITFVGKGDLRPATAISGSDGKYELFTLDSPGAQPGSYSVVVQKMEAPAEASTADAGFDAQGRDLSMVQAAANVGKGAGKSKDLVPPKYLNPETTPLNFEVKNSSNTIELKLE